jgi:ParB/RepB/Spo0J family partition protein
MTTARAATRLRDLAEPGGSDVLRFNPEKIEVEPGHNPRNFDTPEMRARLDELKTSIAASGVHLPLMVRFDAGRAILVDGETRLRACLELIAEGTRIRTVPVISVKGADEEQRIMLALTANTGRPLTQVESGHAFQRLIGHGWTPTDIAAKIGVSKRYVDEALELFDAPKVVKQMVAEKTVTVGRAIAEVRKHGTNAAEVLKPAVEKAKAIGSGPVKREKKPAVNPHKDIVDKIAAELSDEFKSDTDAPFVSVSTGLIREVLALAALN